MTDGQWFVYTIIAPETAVIAAGWWTAGRIRRRRARTAWIRQLERRRRHDRDVRTVKR